MIYYAKRVTDDELGNKYWILFEQGKFHQPTAVIDDYEMKRIAETVLGTPTGEGSHAGGMLYPDLRKMRRAAGLTQGEVSAATGISVSYLSDIERKANQPTITDKVRRVIDYLEGYGE